MTAITVTAQPLAVDRATAAAMLGMSVDSAERYVFPQLRIVRRGRMRIVPVSEIARWLDDNAELALDQEDR